MSFNTSCLAWGSTQNLKCRDMSTAIDIRGLCNRSCIYNDNGKCDMFDDISMPDDVDGCNNYVENV